MKKKEYAQISMLAALVIGLPIIILNSLKSSYATGELPPDPAFKDMNFYECVKETITANYSEEAVSSEGVINKTNLASLKELMCISREIKDLQGIEYLTGLTTLSFSNNQLESIDISKNTMLNTLDVRSNKLKQIDLSSNQNLTTLRLAFNPLTSIDISNNKNLEYLEVNATKILEIDTTENEKLKNIYVGYEDETYQKATLVIIPLKKKADNLNNWYLQDKQGNSVTSGYMGTGLKMIYDGTVADSNGIIVAKGDITGDGLVEINDIAKLYKHIKGKNVMTEDYNLVAADLTGDNKVEINDVAKLYKYHKGKISSLEE